MIKMEGENNGRKLFVCMGMVAMLMTISVASAQPPAPQNDVIVDVTPDSQTGMPGDILRYNVSVTNNGTVTDMIVVDSITGVPAGWAVELKDAGVPQTLPYQTPLLASETSHLLALDVHISAYATAGAAMTINIHSYANHSVTDSDIFGCLVGNKGDLNHDVNITTADAVIALQMVVRGEYASEADMDGDGRVTVVDALMILQAAAGKTVGADTYDLVDAVNSGYIGGIFHSWNAANVSQGCTITYS